MSSTMMSALNPGTARGAPGKPASERMNEAPQYLRAVGEIVVELGRGLGAVIDDHVDRHPEKPLVPIDDRTLGIAMVEDRGRRFGAEVDLLLFDNDNGPMCRRSGVVLHAIRKAFPAYAHEQVRRLHAGAMEDLVARGTDDDIRRAVAHLCAFPRGRLARRV